MTDPLRERRPPPPARRPASSSLSGETAPTRSAPAPRSAPRSRPSRQESRLPPAVPLPRPLRRPPSRPRHEIRIRAAESTDAARCTTISTSYTTSHVWQLDSRSDGEEIRAVFRLVRLPRELILTADQRPPTTPSRRGLLWLVAEQVDVTAGVVGYVGASHPTGDPCAYLQSLAVAPSHRRQGIATDLLAEARRWAAAQGAERLIAHVAARNCPALRLLQRTGFAFCGFNDRCYPKDEVAVFLSVELR